MLRPIKIHQYLGVMRSKGFAAVEVLAGSDIQPERLHDPDYFIDFKQSQCVVSNMIALTGDQGIGLEIGGSAKIADMGIIGHALISTRTLRDTIRLWIAYSNALLGVLSKLDLEEHADGCWTLVISEVAPSGFIYNFCVEEMLMTIVTMSAVLADAPLTPVALELSYPAPSHHELYRQHFSCEIRFNSIRTSATFSSPLLDAARPENDEEFNEICLRHCRQLVEQVENRGPVAARLRDLLMRSAGALPPPERAAQALGTSARSLRRHLAEEGTSYKAVMTEIRLHLALGYLSNSHMSLAPKQVAYLLGFRDTNAFRRAFKSWTGRTVGDHCAGRLRQGKS